MLRQIVLDTETTGLDVDLGHRVIEIGCLELCNRRITGSTFHRFINPQREIERAASEVHGITDEFLKDQPLFRDIIDELIAYIDGAELIIHNAPFDVKFLNYEFRAAGKRYAALESYCKIFDTLVLARSKHPGQRNSLDALCVRYHVDHSNREFHGALLDAELLAQVYLLLTGGQSQLFETDSEANHSMSETLSVQRIPADRERLAVIKASAAELVEHEAIMARIRED